MKATELRLNNYIQHKDGVETVYSLLNIAGFQINDSFKDSNFSGIPLNEEWLYKFGFEPLYFKDNTELSFWTINGSGFLNKDFKLIYFDVQINHVHQLQNLYFALTGEELTIQESAI